MHALRRSSRIASRSATANSQSFVSRLPAEILLRIFEEIDNSHRWHEHLDTVILLKVCRQWYAVASSPLLWKVAHLPTVPSRFRSYLERSQPLPVKLMVTDEMEEHTEGDTKEVQDLVRAHASRLSGIHAYAWTPTCKWLLSFLQDGTFAQIQSFELLSQRSLGL